LISLVNGVPRDYPDHKTINQIVRCISYIDQVVQENYCHLEVGETLEEEVLLGAGASEFD
jgi:hypothetical protein